MPVTLPLWELSIPLRSCRTRSCVPVFPETYFSFFWFYPPFLGSPVQEFSPDLRAIRLFPPFPQRSYRLSPLLKADRRLFPPTSRPGFWFYRTPHRNLVFILAPPPQAKILVDRELPPPCSPPPREKCLRTSSPSFTAALVPAKGSSFSACRFKPGP